MGAADVCAVRVQCCVRCWACSRGGIGHACCDGSNGGARPTPTSPYALRQVPSRHVARGASPLPPRALAQLSPAASPALHTSIHTSAFAQTRPPTPQSRPPHASSPHTAQSRKLPAPAPLTTV
eukprot:39721-Prymnesium_polylepis.1